MIRPPRYPKTGVAAGKIPVVDPKLAQRITLKLGVEGDGIAARILQLLKTWAAIGLSEEAIVEKITEEIQPGGSIFNALINQFSNASGQAVDYLSVEQVHENWKGPDKWVWITVTDENRCEDCKERHGWVRTYEEWEALGIPGAGATICGWRCRCTLEPVEYAGGISLEEVLLK